MKREDLPWLWFVAMAAAVWVGLLWAACSGAAPYVWTKPTTGSPVAIYSGEVRDARGEIVATFAVTDTTWTPPPWVDHVAHRVRVVGFDDLARSGPPSEWSAHYVPREWTDLWFGMGRRLRFSGLSMTVVGLQETLGAWPDSLIAKEP